MTVWLNRAGIPLLVVPVFLAVALLLFLAISRVVVEAGVALLRAPLIAPDFTIASFGPSTLGGGGLTGLAYTYPWTADIVTFPMAAVANGLKIVDTLIGSARRVVFWGILLAVPITFGASCWMVLQPVLHPRRHQPDALVLGVFVALSADLHRLDDPELVADRSDLLALHRRWCGGDVAVDARAPARQLVHEHPLGLAISGTQFTSEFLCFSVFAAWVIKVTVLKYFGGDAYQRSRFLFMGMILGAFATSGTWLVVDYFTGMVGNSTLGGW